MVIAALILSLILALLIGVVGLFGVVTDDKPDGTIVGCGLFIYCAAVAGFCISALCLQ